MKPSTMHRGAMTPNGLRGAFAVVLLALATVLASPVCGAFEHSGSAGACYTALHDGSLMPGQELVTVPEKASFAFVAPALPALQWHAIVDRLSEVDRSQPPPRSLRYHSRSARILI
jgi:hypothetical protein